MKIYNLSNINFDGRLKSGDLVKKLKEPLNIPKIINNSNIASEESLYKTFENPDKLTSKDHTKISTGATTTACSTYSGMASNTTNQLDTWSIYSSLLP